MPVLAALPAPARPRAGATGVSPAGLAAGALLQGRDGRTRLDAFNAGGAVLLGHGHPVIRRAQAWAGPPGPLQARLVERWLGQARAPEAAAATGGGRLALEAALAGARAATGRRRVLGVDGPLDLDGLDDELSASDVAGVLAEPLALGGPALRALRRACDRHRRVLLLDERATSPRCGEGGAQALFGVEADLAVHGPALANGAALGAVLGRRDLVEAARRVRPAGFDPSAPALAAGLAQAELLERDPVPVLLAVRGAELQAELEEVLHATGAHAFARVEGDPTAVALRFHDPDGGAPARAFARLVRREMWMRGVAARGPWRLSTAWGDAEMGLMVDAAAAALSTAVRARRAARATGRQTREALAPS